MAIANPFKWYMRIFGTFEPLDYVATPVGGSGAPVVLTSELENMVTAGTAVKLILGITAIDPDEETAFTLHEGSGGGMYKTGYSYIKYDIALFPFDFDSLTLYETGIPKIPGPGIQQSYWYEGTRSQVFALLRRRYIYIDFGNYPVTSFTASGTHAVEVVEMSRSTKRANGRKTTTLSFRLAKPLNNDQEVNYNGN